MGRLLISLLLSDWKLLPVPLLYLSAYFERHRDEYCDLLFKVSATGRWEDWISFFLRGIAEQSLDAIDRVKKLQDLSTKWRQELTQARETSLSLGLMESLFEIPVITIPRAENILQVSYKSAQRTVMKLVEAGILKQLGETNYNRAFYAPEIFEIIK